MPYFVHYLWIDQMELLCATAANGVVCSEKNEGKYSLQSLLQKHDISYLLLDLPVKTLKHI